MLQAQYSVFPKSAGVTNRQQHCYRLNRFIPKVGRTVRLCCSDVEPVAFNGCLNFLEDRLVLTVKKPACYSAQRPTIR